MSDISKIKFSNSTIYNIADTLARTSISTLDENVVHKAGEETITGSKTFQNRTWFDSRVDTPIVASYDIENTYGIQIRAYQGSSADPKSTFLDFPGSSIGASETVELIFPDESGTLALVSDVQPIIDMTVNNNTITIDNLSQVSGEHSNYFARANNTDLYFPKGTGIIEGYGELDLNKNKITGDKDVQFLIDDLNTIGTTWVSNITMGEYSGALRGHAPSAFIPFWTCAGYNVVQTTQGLQFTLSKPAIYVKFTLTTGFSVAGGGEYKDLIPSNYDEIYVNDDMSAAETILPAAIQGTNPNYVNRLVHEVNDGGNSFTVFTLQFDGRGVYTENTAKINIYKVEVQFEDGSTTYDWNQLAEKSDLIPINATLSAHESLITSLDTRVSAAETTISYLSDYVGDVQIDDIKRRLPTPGPTYEKRILRLDGKLYQCLNQAEMQTTEGDFSQLNKGTGKITDRSKADVTVYWDNLIDIINIDANLPVYKDIGKIKFSSSKQLGQMCIAPTGDLPLNDVTLYLVPYHESSPSVITIQKYVDGTTTTLYDQYEFYPGETFVIELTGLGIQPGYNDYLLIKSDSSSSDQDRRFYITKASCVLGVADFQWVEIGGGGSGDDKMDKANPTGTGAFSLNREASTAVGTNSVAIGNSTRASGAAATATGTSTRASGINAFASGYQSRAVGDCSQAFGYDTTAYDLAAHAEGFSSRVAESVINLTTTTVGTIINTWTSTPFLYAKGTGTHAEGEDTLALVRYSHAEGYRTYASAESAHSEGCQTKAAGAYSHSEGYQTQASAQGAHAEGLQGTVLGEGGHVEGYAATILPSTITVETSSADIISCWLSLTDRFSLSKSTASHAEGFSSLALDQAAHAEGYESTAQGEGSHAEGFRTTAQGEYSHAEGSSTTAYYPYSHAEGYGTNASSNGAHAEGGNNTASGLYAHSEGYGGYANQSYAHKEGNKSIAGAQSAHAEGENTKAVGVGSHSEGQRTSTTGMGAHSEGYSDSLIPSTINYYTNNATIIDVWQNGANKFTMAKASGAHAEGLNTLALGNNSHAQNGNCIAEGSNSHAEGTYTHAKEPAQHVQGQFNADNSSAADIVGWGSSSADKKNISTLYTTGDLHLKGDIYTSANNDGSGGTKIPTSFVVSNELLTIS